MMFLFCLRVLLLVVFVASLQDRKTRAIYKSSGMFFAKSKAMPQWWWGRKVNARGKKKILFMNIKII